MKRLLNCVSDCTRSKRPKLYGPLDHKKQNKEMISATHIYHYIMQDPIIDWLKSQNTTNYSSNVYKQNGKFSEFIMNRGIEFESELIKYINYNRIPVISVSKYITPTSLRQTKQLMYKGTPIIHSAPVRNYQAGTQGIIDLLVRSDYLSNLVDENPLSDDESKLSAVKLGKPYHYVVIDIKFSTLPLRSDGLHLLNSGNYPAYKAQCLIYTEAIGLIQGFTAPHAFIMGRRWNYTKKGTTKHNYTCLNKLGKIAYDTIDIEYKQRIKDAIQWIKDVKKYGANWNLHPPSRKELYPNMCIDSKNWNCEKEKIAEEIGELTNIWYVSVKNRNYALEKGITSWRDNKCNSNIMNIHGVRAPIIDAIMDINRQNIDKIRPNVIKNNIYNWKNNANELYVDFETLSDIFTDFNSLPQQPSSDMIFMIGIGWIENNIWKYKNYICTKPTYEEEYRIMDEFIQFITERNHPKIYYWCAESCFWKKAESRQFDIADKAGNTEIKNHITNNWKINDWADLCKLFQNEPIVIKDCFKFNLKSIAKAMKKHGMIYAHIESDCNNGMSAMINAWKSYTNSDQPENSDIMKDIAKYNEFDVRVIWEILTYLRKNHI